MAKKGKMYIGTSGWHYKHWKGTFYPEGTKDAQQMEYYLQHFDTVEINNSFYKLPSTTTFEKWKEAVPDDFIFAIKGSRFITHMKKLKVQRENIEKFFNGTDRLEEKAGPILFQLPPGWKINAERLKDFLGQLPKDYRYTFEFRNDTWYDEKIYDLLKTNNCAFCIYELAGHISPMEITADFVYIRLHGPGDKYQGSYDHATLQSWADRCRGWQNEGKDVFVYFDNDQEGYAAFNAKTLIEMVHH
ncbi:DUF72 domain-containing protein [Anditalea andensis]|uniref:Sensor histidine kinase n=1 Tax=Anditalea andensis TaxID=1048983 RepID=A0A074KTP1_9BACT|nr:DUF72 domain-containing protein [Anditalea andensis]KEO72279.1 hypothetical protein EL17_16130 [Anditalea andensis]